MKMCDVVLCFVLLLRPQSPKEGALLFYDVCFGVGAIVGTIFTRRMALTMPP